MKSIVLAVGIVGADATFKMSNGVLDTVFDAGGKLLGLTAKEGDATHGVSGDGWRVEIGDVPFPHGAPVHNNTQVAGSNCSKLASPYSSGTTVDQCAYQCMLTEACGSFQATSRPVTWGASQAKCSLFTCAGPFKDASPTAYSISGLKPAVPKSVVLLPASCAHVKVSQPTESTLQALHSGCSGFRVNATYELAEGWHFVTKHLAVCRQTSDGECDSAAGFTVRHVDIWPGLQLDEGTALGAMAMNPYSRKQEFGSQWPPGTGQTASFWRSPGKQTGLFASVQTDYFETNEGFGAFRWGPGRWGYSNSGSWTLGAATDEKADYFFPAAVDNTLNIRAQSAKGGNDLAMLLDSASDPSKEMLMEVTMVQGPYGNKGKAVPSAGYAGVILGAAASPATAISAAAAGGLAAVVTLAEGKQLARILRLTGSMEEAQASEVLAEAPINVSASAPVRLTIHIPNGLPGIVSMSIDGAEVLKVPVAKSDAPKEGGLGVIVLQQDTSFYNFSSSARPALAAPLQPSSSLVQGHYTPMMQQAPSLGAWHQADAGVLGLTQLTGYELAETGVDLGESKAFTACVEQFLMDKEMRKAGAVRYQVAWDSNEYQLDMAREADREQYKRLIRRNAELGIKFQVYEPRNTAVASRWDHSDNWWWEEVLWFQMGIGIRNGSWAPGRDALPPTVVEMMDFFKEQGVCPAAYAYPTLPWRGEGEEEWLFDRANREVLGKRSTLASPKLQDYLIQTMNTFLNVTGGGGFAWDYGIQGDPTLLNFYPEVRGWTRILAGLRNANPGMVMDHRQIAHRFGPWYHLAGSYSEPIAGDENPESYGAALASLSTDHILADNLRLTNYRYRLQLLPNDRVPGFMFHQTERHFNNGTGDDSAGRPGDKIDSNGNAIWKPDPVADPRTGNYSGITYSNSVIHQDWHTRDFDYLGYRYSVLSTIGTAGRNLVVANVPARNLEEYNAFPKEDINWIRKWFDWTDENGEALRRTMPLMGYEFPRLGFVDGTVAVHKDAGFVFLYNPSPDAASATVRLDASLGLGASGVKSWLVSEIYPHEDGMPLGIWHRDELVAFNVPGGAARIVKMEPWTAAMQGKPIAFNISYNAIDVSNGSAVAISGAFQLAGAACDVIVRVPSSQSTTTLIINGQSVEGSTIQCFQGDTCIKASVKFAGSASLRTNAMAAPMQQKKDGSYEASITVTSDMAAQLHRRQASYNISWLEEDLDASWLAPSRLLLYPYVARPSPSLSDPIILIDGKAVPITRQYNSRGNHAIVPPGGGAVSGNTARTFLGWYVDCSHLELDTPHAVSIRFSWTETDQEAHPFSGIYWHNIEDAFSDELIQDVSAVTLV